MNTNKLNAKSKKAILTVFLLLTGIANASDLRMSSVDDYIYSMDDVQKNKILSVLLRNASASDLSSLNSINDVDEISVGEMKNIEKILHKSMDIYRCGTPFGNK